MDGSELQDIGDSFLTPFGMFLIEILLALCFFIGSFLNTILLLVYVRRRGFRSQISNKFLFNLVISNLFWNFILTPILLYDNALATLEDAEAGSEVLIAVFQALLLVGTCGSLLSQLLIGTDQYLAVVNPLHYHAKINNKRCYIMCTGVWVISISIGILNIIDYEHASLIPSQIPVLIQRWSVQDEAPTIGTTLFTNCFVLLLFIIPYGILTFMYTRVFSAAHKNTKKTRRNSICSITHDGIQRTSTGIAPYFGYPTSSNYLGVTRSQSVKSVRGTGLRASFKSSMCHTFSNAGNLFQYREDRRAAKATLLVLVMIFVCWTPYFGLISYYADSGEAPECVKPWMRSAVLLMMNLSSVLSPVLYAYRSRRVQRDVQRVLGLTTFFKERKRKRLERRQLAKMKSFSCPQLLVSNESDYPGKESRSRKSNLVAHPLNSKARNASYMRSAQELVPMMSHEGRSSFSSGSSSGNTASTHITFFIGHRNEDRSDSIA